LSPSSDATVPIEPANQCQAPPVADELDGPHPEPEFVLTTLGLFNDWIKQADVKCGAVLAATGVASGVLFNLIKDRNDASAWLAVSALMCGLALLAAGVFAIAGLRPRLGLRPGRWLRRSPSQTPETGSLLFFVHVHRDYAEHPSGYVDALLALTQDRDAFARAVGQQAHANATVANRKHSWAGRALAALAAALLVLSLIAAALSVDTLSINWCWCPNDAASLNVVARPAPSVASST
jgi:hypothetical protein